MTLTREISSPFYVASSVMASAQVLGSESFLRTLDRCQHIERIDKYLGRDFWAGLTVTGGAFFATPQRNTWRKPALYLLGGVTTLVAIAKLTTMYMSQKCNDRLLEQLGARPTTTPTFMAPDPHDEIADNKDSAERTVTVKHVLVTSATIALAAASAALAVFGFRGGIGMEPVTPGFGATLGGDTGYFGRRNDML